MTPSRFMLRSRFIALMVIFKSNLLKIDSLTQSRLCIFGIIPSFHHNILILVQEIGIGKRSYPRLVDFGHNNNKSTMICENCWIGQLALISPCTTQMDYVSSSNTSWVLVWMHPVLIHV